MVDDDAVAIPAPASTSSSTAARMSAFCAAEVSRPCLVPWMAWSNLLSLAFLLPAPKPPIVCLKVSRTPQLILLDALNGLRHDCDGLKELRW